MIVVAVINLPDSDREQDVGSRGAAPVDVAEAVLARLQDECGYDDDTQPFMPSSVSVRAFTVDGIADRLGQLDGYADAIRRSTP